MLDLRVLTPSDLKGFIFKEENESEPNCELLYGVVKQIERFEQGYKVTLQGGYRGKIVNAPILFEDRGANRRMLATRIEAANVNCGSRISVLVMQRENQRVAMEFKYQGCWRFHGYAGEKNVLIGSPNIHEDFLEFTEYGYGTSYKRKVYFRDMKFPNYPHKCICICSGEKNRFTYELEKYAVI